MTKIFDWKRTQIKESFVHTSVTELDGKPCLRVTKHEDKLNEYDENTYAKVAGIDFHNGTIEVTMLARLLPDAPVLARGFIGIAFRINEDDTAFESYYVRPTNGIRVTDDPVRQSHGTQYFSYPTYTFEYFRAHGITRYDSEADIALDEWISLKAVVEGERAAFYVNDMEKPALVVDRLIHGADSHGGIGLFVDIGTEAFFRELKVTKAD